MTSFRSYILEADKTNYDGEILRNKDFKIVKVGGFEVGKLACFISPVRKETLEIIRFENGGRWAVFNSGRVEVSHMIGWEPNPNHK